VSVTLTTIDPVLRVSDICQLLKISPAQFYAIKDTVLAAHGLLVEIQPRIDRHPRFSGEPFVRLLSDKNQARLFRAQIKELAS
jgi:hypothetical protein